MKALLTIVCLIFLFSCHIDKRNVERMQVYAIRYPDQFKLLANKLDPCFLGTAKSYTIVKHDTTTVKGDTTISTVIKRDTVFVTKRIQLPGQIIKSTITIRDTVVNDRAIAAIQSTIKGVSDSLIVVKTKLAQSNKSGSMWKWTAIGLIVLIVAFLAIKIYLIFAGGGVASLIKKV